MLRNIAIWVFGILASTIVGGFAGHFLNDNTAEPWGVLGAIGGMFMFACIRLWAGQPRKQTS